MAVDGVVRGSSGLLGRTDRQLVALRSEPGGQRGQSKAGGKKSWEEKLTGGGGWFCFELRVAAAAARVLGAARVDGRGAGVRGLFNGQGPWVSARKEGWEGGGDRGGDWAGRCAR